MKKLILSFYLMLVLSSCTTGKLDPTGAYGNNAQLYADDRTLTVAYDLLNGFVNWEKNNQTSLASKPAIHKAAEKIRVDAPGQFKVAVQLRDAYEAQSSSANQQALAHLLIAIQDELDQATLYMTTNGVDAVSKPVLISKK